MTHLHSERGESSKKIIWHKETTEQVKRERTGKKGSQKNLKM